jgi:hypothetical protein
VRDLASEQGVQEHVVKTKDLLQRLHKQGDTYLSRMRGLMTTAQKELLAQDLKNGCGDEAIDAPPGTQEIPPGEILPRPPSDLGGVLTKQEFQPLQYLPEVGSVARDNAVAEGEVEQQNGSKAAIAHDGVYGSTDFPQSATEEPSGAYAARPSGAYAAGEEVKEPSEAYAAVAHFEEPSGAYAAGEEVKHQEKKSSIKRDQKLRSLMIMGMGLQSSPLVILVIWYSMIPEKKSQHRCTAKILKERLVRPYLRHQELTTAETSDQQEQLQHPCRQKPSNKK